MSILEKKLNHKTFPSQFFLLIIPILISILLIILCCLRPCNKFLQRNFNTTCFREYRSGESLKAGIRKTLDATIVYSEYDEAWVHSKLLPIIAMQGKAYKIHLLTTYHKGFDKICKKELEKLNISKRVILVMSEKFISKEWDNEHFQSILKNLCAHDFDCVLVPIVIDDGVKNYVHKMEKCFEEEKSCSACKKRIKYSTILNSIEKLNFKDKNFASDLRFLMPIMKITSSDAVITDVSFLKFETNVEIDRIIIREEDDSIILRKKKRHIEDPFDCVIPRNSIKRETEYGENYFDVVSSMEVAKRIEWVNKIVKELSALRSVNIPEPKRVNIWDTIKRKYCNTEMTQVNTSSNFVPTVSANEYVRITEVTENERKRRKKEKKRRQENTIITVVNDTVRDSLFNREHVLFGMKVDANKPILNFNILPVFK